MLNIECAYVQDFGTTRDINKMQATQYYTVGVGTPIYMPPVSLNLIISVLLLQELLSKGKYNESADCYRYPFRYR